MSADNNDPDKGHDQSIGHTQPRVRPHQDPDLLRELYHDEGLSQTEVGDELGCDQATVSKWMRKFGIETRPPMHERERKAVYRSVDDNGKVQYLARNGDGPERLVSEHQLVALLEYDAEDVFAPETHVHHLMAAPHAVDLPENLVVLNHRDHIRRHAEGTATDDPEVILAHIRGEFDPDIGSTDETDREGGS
jgi:transcriptional regulator with XRE-family HTH domain